MADFKDYRKITFNDMVTYVRSEKKEYESELVKAVQEGKSFLDIKKAFYEECFPDYVPKKEKKLTMYEILGMEKPEKPKKSKKK